MLGIRCVNKEIIALISVSNVESFDELARCNKQVTRRSLQGKGLMQLKCKCTQASWFAVNTDFKPPSRIATSTSRNGSEGPGGFLACEPKVGVLII